MKKTQILIADDHTLFGDGLEQIVQTMEGFEVIGKVTDGKMLMQKLNTHVPDIILLDINMPYLNGMDAAKKILKLHPSIKIIFISMYNIESLTLEAKKIGAFGFILKDATAPVLKHTILQVNQGEKAFVDLKNKQASTNHQDQADEDPFARRHKLSPRELDIIQLIKEGNTSKQIASDLQLSIYTVETHRKNIHRKLHVQCTAELIAWAHQQNL